MNEHNHWFQQKYPKSWAWAFEDEFPAYLTMTQSELSRELERKTGDILTAAAINHIVRDLGFTKLDYTVKSESRDEVVDVAATLTPEEAVEVRLTAAQQLIQIRAEQRYLRDLEQAEARRRVVIQALKDGAALLPPPSKWAPMQLDALNQTPHTMLLLFSDLHAGKFVDPELVGDRFSYDKFILEESVAQWLRGVKRFLGIYRQSFPINKIVLAVLGDIVEGSTMRESQRIRLDRNIGTIGRQTTYAGRLLAEILRDLASEVEQVQMLAVAGNHGRVGKFSENETVDNFDWLAYNFAEAHCTAIPNIKFFIPDTSTAFVKLGSKSYFFQHGDAIRSYGESPAGAVKRAVRKDAFVNDVVPDYSFLGHFHQAISMQIGGRTRVYMNGNWDGGDSYCVTQLKEACEPSQSLFIIHPSRGIVGQHELCLREVQVPPSVPFEFETIAG